jgi:hypothetical protein
MPYPREGPPPKENPLRTRPWLTEALHVRWQMAQRGAGSSQKAQAPVVEPTAHDPDVIVERVVDPPEVAGMTNDLPSADPEAARRSPTIRVKRAGFHRGRPFPTYRHRMGVYVSTLIAARV